MGLAHNLDMGFLIANGNFSFMGAVPFASYGERTTTGAETLQVIWPDGVWKVPPAMGLQMRIVSTSASDGVGGTGIRSLHIHYLDANLDNQDEIIILNGTTPVNTVATNIRFIQCMHIATYGSANKAVGNISLTDVTGTNTYSYISIGDVRCSSSARMVPRNKVLFITGAVGGANSATADASVVLKLGISKFEGHDYTADALLIPVVGIPLQNSSLAFDFSIPAGGYEEGTIVAVLGSTNKAATLGASLFGFLVNKGV